MLQQGQFLSDVGGAIGLWVGASVLTMAEYIEYFIDLIVLSCLKMKRGRTSPVRDISRNGGAIGGDREKTIDMNDYSAYLRTQPAPLAAVTT